MLLVPAGHFDADALYERIHNILVSHGASVGFMPAIGASYSQGNISAYTLYDQASLASHEAKTDLRTRVKFFSQAMVSRAEADYNMLSEFKNALANDEITFYLQPQCRSANGRIVGAEALARWIRPDGRMVPPASFIPTLERYGFVPDLDRRIWEEVCKWTRRVLDEGQPLVPVSVNISPVDIFRMDVPEFFDRLIEKYRLPREAIKLEITESAYSEDSEKIRSTVQAFRDRGFVVLMDDFGSGFSSLNMLRELNANEFYKRLVPAREHSFWSIAHKCAERRESTSAELKIRRDDGSLLNVIVDADYVDDELGDVRCILSMSKK